jgi:hypothetical protein
VALTAAVAAELGASVTVSAATLDIDRNSRRSMVIFRQLRGEAPTLSFVS